MDVTVSPSSKRGVSWRVHSQVRRLYRTATGSTSAELNAIICMTDTSGKTLCNAGLFIHQYRSWQKKRVSIVLCKTFAAVLLKIGNVKEPVRVLFSLVHAKLERRWSGV